MGPDGGGNKGHVHGLDRKLAAAQAANADARSSAKRPAFALRDAPASDARRAARGTNGDAGNVPETLAAMFGDALPADAIEDVYRQCGCSVESAVEALSVLTTNGEERTVSPSSVPTASAAAAAPRRRSSSAPTASRSGADLWDALPAELRLLVLDLVGPKDAARAARTCRDFAETVRAWRANKKHLAPPAALTVTGVCSLIRAYPNLESVSLRRCARGRLRYSASDVFRVLRAAASGPAARTLRSVDLEGCDVADADVVALLETFATPSGPAGRRGVVHLRAQAREVRSRDRQGAGRARRASRGARTAVGIRRRHGGHRGGREGRPRGRGAGGLPLLERFDFSGCLDAKGALALPPLMTAKALRAAYLPALTALTAQLPKHAGLASLHVSQCVNLRRFT